MRHPSELPSSLSDFRRYAKKIVTTPDLLEELTQSLDPILLSRAIQIGQNKVKLNNAKRSETIQTILEKGMLAAKKIADEPNLIISPEEDSALEAVARLTERPAILVRNDSFPPPPKRWEKMDRVYRKEISRRIPSSGRISVSYDGATGMVGTGFVVAEDLIMTNSHVTELFAVPSPDKSSWVICTNRQPVIDFKVEYEIPEKRVFNITEVVGVHPTQDLALLRVTKKAVGLPGAPLPPPVTISSDSPNTDGDLDLYLVGYPWTDNEGITPAPVIQEIFDNVFQVKRLQPGEFGAMFEEYGVFSHDCSTLGGNSGSYIVDLDTDLVIGIHYRGKYREANYAVALWKLQNDNLFVGRGINFEN